MSERREGAAPEGAINEAISTLDHIGRPDLGTAVKDLWREWREAGMSEGRERSVWVGVETPAPNYPQKVQPNEVCVFATEGAAIAWKRARPPSAVGPLREVYKRPLVHELKARRLG